MATYAVQVSVVTRATRLRWVAASVAVAGIMAAPALVNRLPDALADLGSSAAPLPPLQARALLENAVHSSDVSYQGLAESRGTLGLPDIPRLGSVAALLGGTTRTRVWWSSTDAWRVDVLTTGGEQGTYAQPAADGGSSDVVTWDFERNEVVNVLGGTAVRLPRADDLVPPAAARRLLAGVAAADPVSATDGGRVQGRSSTVLHVRAADARSTVGRVDVWVDEATALPLRVRVVDRSGRVVFTSSFVSLSLTRPSTSLLRPPSAPGARHETTSIPDLVAAVDQRFPYALPRSLAGLAASPRVGGVSSYGQGLVRFVVLPLPRYLSGDALDAISVTGKDLSLTGGQARVVATSLIDTVIVVGDAGRAYLVAGFVTAETLRTAAQELLDNPPASPDITS